MASSDGNDPCLAHEVEDLAGGRSIADEIADRQDGIHLVLSEALQDRFERRAVGVQVTEDRVLQRSSGGDEG